MARFSVALVHHPVLHKDGSTIASAITNTDLHDITRTATTYGVAAFYIVTPVAAQQALANRLIHHWTHGRGSERNPDRASAFAIMHVVPSLTDALAREAAHSPDGMDAWASSAQPLDGAISLVQGRKRLAGPRGAMLVLGTAHGLAAAAVEQCTVRLEPLPGCARQDGKRYNHLSVRAAAAIMIHALLADGPSP